MSLPWNTNTTWSTSCSEPKRPHTGWTWADSSSCLRNRMTCLFADEECRIRTPWTEETACCLPIIVVDKEHISRREAYSTSRPCLLHSWCSTDGTEDPAPNDDTRSSYRWNTNLSITPPCRCKRDSAVYSTRSEPTRPEESFSTMITVTLLATWDPLVSICNSPLSTRFNSSFLFLGALLHLVLRIVLHHTQFFTHSLRRTLT